MEHLKRKPGLILVAAIWLVVLLIPIWRQRAVRHWQTDLLYVFNQTPDNTEQLQLGLTNEGEQKLAQLYPNDPAVQLQLLHKPKAWTPPLPPPSAVALPVLSVEESIKQANQRQKTLRTVNDEYFDRYAALVKRYPNSPFIRSQWLQKATNGSLAVESNEFQEHYQTLLPPNQISSAPIQIKRTSWLSKATTEKTLECARAGARIEPDNSYWRWMEAVFNFSLRREDEALAALRAAGKCRYYDDGCLNTTNRNIDLIRRVQLCDTEDEFDALASIMFPHFAPMRASARQAMWDARIAFRKGDKARAIEIADIVQQAALPMARTEIYGIARLVGIALMHIGWREILVIAELPIPPQKSQQPTEEQLWERRHRITAAFADYARRLDKPAIAKRALQIDSIVRNQPQGMSKEIAERRSDIWSTDRMANRLMVFQSLGYWLLKLAITGSVLWLLALPLSRGSGEVAPVTRRLMVVASAFSTGVTGALLWWALENGAIPYFNFYDSEANTADLTLRAALPAYFILTWAVPVALFALAVIIAPQRKLMQIDTLSRWQFLFTILTICGFYTVGMALTEPLENSIAGQFWPAPLLLFWACYMAMTAIYIKKARATQKIAVMCWGGSIACWMAWLFLNASSRSGLADFTVAQLADEDIQWIGIASLGLALFAVVAWIRGGGLQGLLQNPAVATVQLHIRFVAATLAVGASLAYLGTNLVSIPTRSRIHHAVQRQIQVGEIRYIQEQLQQKSS
jgi:hypothetical protein